MIDLPESWARKFKHTKKSANEIEGPVVIEWIKQALNSGQYQYTSRNSIMFYKVDTESLRDYEAHEPQEVVQTIAIEVSWK